MTRVMYEVPSDETIKKVIVNKRQLRMAAVGAYPSVFDKPL